eukprot:27179-Amphidinium_carterae.1
MAISAMRSNPAPGTSLAYILSDSAIRSSPLVPPFEETAVIQIGKRRARPSDQLDMNPKPAQRAITQADRDDALKDKTP